MNNYQAVATARLCNVWFGSIHVQCYGKPDQSCAGDHM